MNSIRTATKWQRLQRYHSLTLKDGRLQSRRGRGEPHPKGRMATYNLLSAGFFGFFLWRETLWSKKPQGKRKETREQKIVLASVCSRFLANNSDLLCCRKTEHLAGALLQKSRPKVRRSLTLPDFQGHFSLLFCKLCYLSFSSSISLKSKVPNSFVS